MSNSTNPKAFYVSMSGRNIEAVRFVTYSWMNCSSLNIVVLSQAFRIMALYESIFSRSSRWEILFSRIFCT